MTMMSLGCGICNVVCTYKDYHSGVSLLEYYFYSLCSPSRPIRFDIEGAPSVGDIVGL